MYRPNLTSSDSRDYVDTVIPRLLLANLDAVDRALDLDDLVFLSPRERLVRLVANYGLDRLDDVEDLIDEIEDVYLDYRNDRGY